MATRSDVSNALSRIYRGRRTVALSSGAISGMGSAWGGNSPNVPFADAAVTTAQIVALFGGGEQGVVLDPSYLPSLSQDDAGATPVTADDQLVGRIADLSPKGNHLTQATAGSKPKYKTSGGLSWLLPDALDDYLASAAFAWGSDKLTLVVGVRHVDGSVHIEVGFGATNLTANTFELAVSPSANAGSRMFRRGDGTSGNYGDGSVQSLPRSIVVASQVDLSGTDQATENPVYRVNGSAPGAIATGGTADQTGSFGTNALELFRRAGGTLYASKPLYGLIAINRLLTAAEITLAERWTAQRTGVTLS